MSGKEEKKGSRDRIGKILYIFYILALIGALAVVGKLIYTQWFFKPDPTLTKVLTPAVTKSITKPERGAILARDGRALAISFTTYTIAMDPSVMKDVFAADKEKGKEREKAWLQEARALSEGLARIFPEKSSGEYYEMIRKDREAGKRYRAIGQPVSYETLQEIKALPLFNQGQYKGGLIVTQKDVRQYPYGSLARRTIGFVRDNTDASSNNYIGLEGKYNHRLHGQLGYQYMKTTDGRNKIKSYDSLSVKAVDGEDIRTTLDVDFQDLADKSLRAQIDTNRKIEGGCAIVMEVKTGAIRAMVNLKRNPESGNMEESMNYAIGRAGEPGSIFKATTIMTAIEDGYLTSLDEKIPTNHGDIAGLPHDAHISDWEREHNTKEISVLDGLKMSSNYVFAYLAIHNYADKPQDFIDKLYMYKLGEAFDFDLDGMATPVLPNPKTAGWSLKSLGTTAYGYSVAETPLHILTFYNAIANGGKMMKPYLVESIEKDGMVTEKLGPSILNASICKKATADTITRGLKAVVGEGTAKRLKNTKTIVAGKTGTARIVLDNSDSPTHAGRYQDERGRKKNQATFVGFFPADQPKYSLIVVVYSILDSESFYGGTLPALAARGIVDGIWAIEPEWREELQANGKLAAVDFKLPEIECKDDNCVLPELKGLGLNDVLYLLEDAGLECEYSGVGHVAGQSPKAGTKVKKGSKVKITLK